MILHWWLLGYLYISIKWMKTFELSLRLNLLTIAFLLLGSNGVLSKTTWFYNNEIISELQLVWNYLVSYNAWKVSVFRGFLVSIFPHSESILRDTEIPRSPKLLPIASLMSPVSKKTKKVDVDSGRCTHSPNFVHHRY